LNPTSQKRSKSAIRGLIRDAHEVLDSLGDDAVAMQPIEDSSSLTEEQREHMAEVGALVREGVDIPQELVDVVSEDGSFRIEPTDDKMQLVLRVEPPIGTGRPVERSQVIAELKNLGVVRGVLGPAIGKVLRRVEADDEPAEAVIVRGRPPVAGRDGLVKLFRRETPDSALRRADVPLEQAEPDHQWTCKPDDIVAQVVPPKPGKAGFDALGQPIAAPASSEPDLAPGENIERRDGKLIAKAGGVIVIEDGKVHVKQLLILPGDLTPQDPAVRFDGEVRIQGTVRSGVELEATGDIEIAGAVEAATVTSTAGSITIKKGVVGKEQAQVRAEGGIVAKFAEKAFLRCNGDMTLTNGLLHCRAVCAGHLKVTGSRGRIAGGRVLACKHVDAQQIGAPGELRTSLIVGLSRESLDALSEDEAFILRWRQRAERLKAVGDKIQRMAGDVQSLGPDEKQTFAEVRCRQVQAEQAVKAAEDRLAERLADAADNVVATVKAGVLRPGVTVQAGARVHRVDQERQAAALVAAPGEPIRLQAA
jgi:uncharacterized protein (DUF342 family)